MNRTEPYPAWVYRAPQVAYRANLLADVIEDALARDARIILAIGDSGGLTIVAALLHLSMERGSASLTAIDAIVMPQAAASSRRVRAMVEWLDQTGGVVRTTERHDRRTRPFRPSGWLLDALRTLACTLALRHGFGLSVEAVEPDRLLRLIARRIGHASPDHGELGWLFDARAGYLLLLRLVGAARRRDDGIIEAELSRKRLARVSGVSRAHFTGLLARMEACGWLVRTADNRVWVDPTFLRNSRGLLAGHLVALDRLVAEARAAR